MKYNVSKFLIKSILSTASVVALIPGFVSGMEDEYVTDEICAICHRSIVKNDIPELGKDQVKVCDIYKLNGCPHRFCKSCIKRWIKGDNTKCPMCKCVIQNDEIQAIKLLELKRTRNLTSEQKSAVDRWNSTARKDHEKFYKNEDPDMQAFLDSYGCGPWLDHPDRLKAKHALLGHGLPLLHIAQEKKPAPSNWKNRYMTNAHQSFDSSESISLQIILNSF